MAYAAVVSVNQKIGRLHHPKLLQLKPIHHGLHLLESLLEQFAHMQGSNLRFDPLEHIIEHLADKIDHAFTPPPRPLEAQISSATSRFADLNLTSDDDSTEILQLAREIPPLIEELNETMSTYYSMEKELQLTTPLLRLEEQPRRNGARGRISDQLDRQQRRFVILPSDNLGGRNGRHRQDRPRASALPPSLRRRRVQLTLLGNNRPQLQVPRIRPPYFLGIKGFHSRLGDDELRRHFDEVVKGRKHLVVLDDVWSVQDWMELLKHFPEEKTGSVIVLITRLFDVANHEIVHYRHEKSFESWILLHRTVFTNPLQPCTYSLAKFGKEIAKNCEGLPLAILAVGRHLHVSEKTVEYWEEVSKQENLRDIIKEYYDYSILPSLALSYRMLPRRMKQCFLYIGVVPNYEISVSELVNLWVVEGFIGTPPAGKSLEEVAEEFLHKVVSQSVVLVRQYSSRRGRIKICRIHFIFRNLCIAEAQNERFCYVMRK